MYRWLLENFYSPLGGRRHPDLAVLAAFAVSGLLHEYVYAMTFQRIAGYNLAFFLLHGLAVLLTRRLKPAGRLLVPAAVLTSAFNTVSTVLLFIPIDERAPLYTNEVPKWMHLW